MSKLVQRTFIILFLVDDLPNEAAGDGPGVLPTEKGDGVYFFYKSSIFELKCSPIKCQWIKKPLYLRVSREFSPVVMYIDSDLANCT